MIGAGAFELAIFDLDGVVTRTAAVHAVAWKRLFDTFLEKRFGPGFEPFGIDSDYVRYVDGRPRYDGVRTFLASRNVVLPEGAPEDSPSVETVCGLGNAKNRFFRAALEQDGVDLFEDTLDLIGRLRANGIGIAVVSASENCGPILEAAGLTGLIDARVDGLDIRAQGLAGKPAPDSFLEAARRLGVPPEKAVVFEDAFVGVEAGKAGGFGLVVGVDRTGQGDAFLGHGADIALDDLSAIRVEGLPNAHEAMDTLAGRFGADRALICLDYDGTLTPIVDRPEDALLSPATRDTLLRLARLCPVAVVTGRDLDTIRDLVGLDIVYVADHGFVLAEPDSEPEDYQPAAATLGDIDEVERAAAAHLAGIEGVLIERKRFTVAVHYRLVAEAERAKVHAVIQALLEAHPALRSVEGKMVHEFRPDIPWDKGRAVLRLAEHLDRSPGDVIYIGDDVTDEDVFRALGDRGMSVVVRDRPRMTAARYVLRDASDVRTFLIKLAERWDSDRRA